MKTAEKRKIEKLEELNKLTEEILVIEFTDGCSVSVWNKFTNEANQLKSELAAIDKEIEQGEEKHETCDGCIMFQDCGCMIDDSCRPCVDRDQWTSQEQMDKRINDAFIEISHHCELAVDDIKAAIVNYIDGKNIELTKADSDKRKRADEDRIYFTDNMDFLKILTKWCNIHDFSFSGRESSIITSAVNEYMLEFSQQSVSDESDGHKYCIDTQQP